jgi:hypothetical protein
MPPERSQTDSRVAEAMARSAAGFNGAESSLLTGIPSKFNFVVDLFNRVKTREVSRFGSRPGTRIAPKL